MRLKSKIADKRGFTLIEIIVSLVVAGILSVFYFHFMGTAMNHSWQSVELVAGEAEAALIMETIIADYTDLINNIPGSGPPLGTSLSTIKGTNYLNEVGLTIYYVTGVTMVYVKYDSGGNLVELSGADTSNYLKVTVHAPGNDLTTILSQSRTKTSDPAVFF
jgi:prepilin-type N-terminal cleavage/methylation domain-containing protein